ncbi:MAG: hypothetical protein LHV68_02415 [Elusimicrobia bacterium]|nr:hypothetical protein [Candidatus Liberimonas magnetica]
MKQCRFIISKKQNGYYNIALDEALFSICKESKPPFSVFRIYTWAKPCLTIGYFQKYNEIYDADLYRCKIDKLPVIRRLTGGLAVLHKNDVSYSLITNSSDWPYVYEQEKSYKAVHSTIRSALIYIGINAEFIKYGFVSSKNSVCVDTMFNYDLHLNGEKIVGSCQRRSGKILLQQGSLHLPGKYDLNKLSSSLRKELKNVFKMQLMHSSVSDKENKLANDLVNNKYSSVSWSQKFIKA